MFYEKNIDAFPDGNPHHIVFKYRLSEAEISDECQILETESEEYNLWLKDIPLHYDKSPLAEAKRKCELHLHPGAKNFHIIVGLGLGHLLDEVFEQTEGTILIYDTLVDVMKFTFTHVDLSPYIESGRVYFFAEETDLIRYLFENYLGGDHIDYIPLTAYKTLMSDLLEDSISEIIKILTRATADRQSSTLLLDSWLKESFYNLRFIPQSYSIDSLKEHFKGKPAILASSGPSLDDAMPYLREIQDKVIIIAVGGAVRPLMNNGITPDFHASLDFSGPQAQLNNLPYSTKDIHFVLGPFAERYCFEIPSKETFMVSFSNSALTKEILNKRIGFTENDLMVGCSISSLVYQLGHFFGCDPLILVGTDLALRGTQQYAGGIHAKVDTKNQRMAIDDNDEVVSRDIRMVEVEGQNGEKLQTGVDYSIILLEFEDLASLNEKQEKPRKIYNASVGGALIKGFTHLPLEKIPELQDLPPLDKSLNLPPQQSEKYRQKTIDVLTEILDSVEGVYSTTQEFQDSLTTIIEADPSEWPTLAKIYQEKRKLFLDSILGDPLFSYTNNSILADLVQASEYSFETPEAILTQFKTELEHATRIVEFTQNILEPAIKDTRDYLADHPVKSSQTIS